jgi:hypothetical protein
MANRWPIRAAREVAWGVSESLIRSAATNGRGHDQMIEALPQGTMALHESSSTRGLVASEKGGFSTTRPYAYRQRSAATTHLTERC